MARVPSAARASWLAVVLGFAPVTAAAATPDLKPPAAVARPATSAQAKPANAAQAKLSKAGPKSELKAKSVKTKARPAITASGAAKSRPAARAAQSVNTTEPVNSSEPVQALDGLAPDGLKASDTAPDPQRGVGTRSLAALPSAMPEPRDVGPGLTTTSAELPAEESEKAEQLPKPEKQTLRAAHQQGKPPHKPSATVPADAARAIPDRAARQKIAEGPTDEDLRAGQDDPELRSLKAAERVLFPRPLSGVDPGWSWDLPEALSSSGPEVITQGTARLLPERARADRGAIDGAPDADWLRSLTMPNLPVVLDEFVLKYLRFYRDSPSGKSIARVWAKKSGRYTPAIRAELARAGVPTDLVWLSMIESGHNPSITSPAGAAGLWQFMPDAGRTYGLTVDRWVDERLDPERSTEAAGRYLSDLYRRFGSWELAVASYNMGYAGLARSIRKFNSNDFWELSRYEAGVPWETTLYVPKIFALAIVMNNKKAFGLDTVETDAPETFDVVLVGPSVSLEDVARAAGVPEAALDALNPGYLAGRTPPWLAASGASKPSWHVRVPLGTGAACSAALARISGDDESFETYLSKFGDTVESIANAHGVSEARLRAVNHVEPKELLASGTLLLVPRLARTAVSEPNDEVVVVPPREFAYAERSRLFYRVLQGDTLSRVASVFAVSPADLSLWNALDENARLQSGMALQLFVDKSQSFSARTLSPSETHVLVAGSPEFYDYFEAQNGRKRLLVSAHENDTLGSLGKRYGMTVGSMERVNRRSRTDKLHAGESIVVYVDRGRAVSPRQKAVEADSLASGTLLPLEPALDGTAPDGADAPPGSSPDAAEPAEPGAP